MESSTNADNSVQDINPPANQQLAPISGEGPTTGEEVTTKQTRAGLDEDEEASDEEYEREDDGSDDYEDYQDLDDSVDNDKGKHDDSEGDTDDDDSIDETIDDSDFHANFDDNADDSDATRTKFQVLVRDTAEKPQELCPYCFDLILHLQKRVPRRSMDWKRVAQLLFDGAYQECDLCELVASAPAIYLDDLDPDNKYPLKPLREYEELFTEFLDMSMVELTPNNHPIEAFGHVNVLERICEVSFNFEFHGRPAQVVLAVWLEPLPETTIKNPLRRFENPQPERCEGVYTGSDITWRRPLSKTVSWQSFELIESWISTCMMDHPMCACTLSDELIDDNWHGNDYGNTDLPSRVLHVLGEDENIIRLVEIHNSDVKKAPYVTLSHCWGPPDKQPLRTTLSNLQAHTTTGIPLSSFPKTFRDAISITRQLSLPYLWIDSLCIIQDSPADWLSESSRMGAIYERAALTVAASDAHNSTEGCFLATRPSTPSPVKFVMRLSSSSASPSAPTDNENTHTLFRTCFSPLPTPQANNPSSTPYLSPLACRAWVCQEWYLSRRILFCTQTGFLWKCRGTQVNERGRYLHDMNERREWEWLMQRYSESLLTRETDRLVAMQGIVNELGKGERKGMRWNRWGVWVGEEGKDGGVGVCWMVRGGWGRKEGGKGLEGVPSWSWAGVVGAKVFWKTQWQCFEPCRGLIEGVDDDGDENKGVLMIRGARLRKVDVKKLEKEELESQPAFLVEDDSKFWLPEALFIGLRRFLRPDMPVHSILSDKSSGIGGSDHITAVGLAAFDRDVDAEKPELLSREIYAIPMVESPRFGLDPFLPEDAGTEWHGEDIHDKVLFGDLSSPEPHGRFEFYPVQGLKLKSKEGPPRKYNMMARASKGESRPVGYYTPPTLDGAEKKVKPDARYKYDGSGTSIFWALLVEPVTNETGTKTGSYRRIGMGLIGNETWLGTGQCRDVAIV